MRLLTRRLLSGAGAGLIATIPMSAVMFAAQRLSTVDELDPEIITETGLEAAAVGGGETTENLVSSVAHLGFGAAVGALYGLVKPLVSAPPLLTGPLYGLVVAGANYQGWLPAMGILPPLSRRAPARISTVLLSHVVYGAVLGPLANRR
ncbi:MAG: DUF1440 domain-containing protein [Actinomycetota bacterium]|nr:DUF1440 domain-containing protein [Actinomycetota bacterium]MDQ3639923.1 DUF1440 domain-containing protein [Actinomycetota bacterium]